MSVAVKSVLSTTNPATGAVVGRIDATEPGQVPALVERARAAQQAWEARPWPARREFLRRWWRVLARDATAWRELIRDEIGKPGVEALAGDVVPTLDALRWTVTHGNRVLRDLRVGSAWQRWLLLPGAKVRHAPYGVVGMIGTWNYPLFLNVPPIAQALAAGNAVVWKPSELALATAARIQESLSEAGMPPDLVIALPGGPEVGQALVDANLDKALFTGGVANGRRVIARLGSRGIPAVAELSGFDAAIVLPGSPMQSTVDALVWAAFVGCGQTCVAVKRVYVVGEVRSWSDRFAARTLALKVGDPALPGTDLGPMITSAARQRFHEQVQDAITAGARVLAGAQRLDGPGWFYAPTVLEADTEEPAMALEGAFGPVVLIRGVPTAEAAIEAANSSRYALGASLWGRDLSTLRRMSSSLRAGMVCINDAVTPTAHAGAPFGGSKASGFGRTHGSFGLLEFTQSQAVFERGAGGFRPQLFPYTRSSRAEGFLQIYRRVFHRP